MFAQSMLLTNGGPEMTTRGVVSLIYDTAFGDYRLGYGAAISWLLFLLIAGFSLIQYRLIRRGAAD
jgi:ABC-type sugar transport system permease subunit